MSKKWIYLMLLLVCVTQSGCDLLALPGEIIGGMFGLAGQALGIASTLPMPPPWVFF